jgi:hypothetical protein
MTGVVAQAVADLLDRSDERDLKDRMLQARRDGWLAGREDESRERDQAFVTAPRTRRMKVRWPRRVACGHYILTGQVIVQRDGRWSCLAFALAEVKTSAAEARSEQ